MLTRLDLDIATQIRFPDFGTMRKNDIRRESSLLAPLSSRDVVDLEGSWRPNEALYLPHQMK